MTELPRLFNDAAEFIEPDAASVSALSPELLKALDDIRSTYNATQEAEQNVEGAAQDEITEALAQVAPGRSSRQALWPYDRFRLWQQTVKGI